MLQLLHMLDDWTKNLESGGQIDVIYTDYEKAFDKVPHRRLLNKIFSFGLPIQIVNWIRFFLHNRFYKVKINSSLSDSYPVPGPKISENVNYIHTERDDGWGRSEARRREAPE